MKKYSIIPKNLSLILLLFLLWLYPMGKLFFLFPWDSLGQLVNHPAFLSLMLDIPQEKTQPFFTQAVLSRYGFLSHNPASEEPAPPSPSPLPLPQEELPVPSQPVEEGDWLVKTMEGNESQVEHQGIYVNNSGKVLLSPQDLQDYRPPIQEKQEEIRILIYHSHGTESYSQTPDYTYEESDDYRSLDPNYNITAIGKAMADYWEEAGFYVVHDTSLHDYPDYNSSYQNSASMLADYLAEESFDLILDVHRDALSASDGTPYQLLSQDPQVAQVMFVVGTDGGGYDHPRWEENFSLALQIQEELLRYPDFSRPITLRTSRYNQQQAPQALLLEIGGHGNTFPQAREAGLLFAEAVVSVFLDSES